MFKKCLAAIAKLPGVRSVAFPYKIGCGLGGGNWVEYRAALEEFARSSGAPRVRVYKLPQNMHTPRNVPTARVQSTPAAGVGQVVEVQGDLLSAKEQYIAQQCNCTSHRALGLSAAVFKRFPHSNVYQFPGRRQAGTISVHGGQLGQRGVINMMAQVNTGRCVTWVL